LTDPVESKGMTLKNIVRDPKIVWRTEAKREAEVIAALEAGEDVDEQGTVILVVAGTMHQLNYVGGSIWQMCDGTRNRDAIADTLAAEFSVDRNELVADVDAFIKDLVERGWLNYVD